MKKLNERQEKILLSLKKLDFLNRDQLSTIHRLGKVRNTNRILKELSPFLSTFRDEYSSIYFLNKDGREYVNSNKLRKRNKFVNHVIMRNQFYIFAGFPHDWKNEMKVQDGQYTVIADAIFKTKGMYHFLEIDSIQKMKENQNKINQYKGLMENGVVKEHLGHFPKLIWVTTTELRRKQLSMLCKDFPCEIYTIDEIK